MNNKDELTHLSLNESSNNDEFIYDKPLQQSKKWNIFQNGIHKKTIFSENKNYSYLGIYNKTIIGNYIFFPYGPYIECTEGLKVYSDIISIAKKEKCIFIRVEPQNSLSKDLVNRWKRVKDVNPSHTLIIDIAKPFEEIMSDFSASTRRHYRAINKTNLKIVKSKNINDAKYIFELQSKLFKRKGLNFYPLSYFEEQLKEDFSILYLCYLDEKVVGAVLYFDYLNTRYYMQAATDENYKNLPIAVDLVTSAIIDAKEKGLTKFDFWGIAPQNADKSHPWYGFTTFKKRFGGTSVSYLGTYDIILNYPLYYLYSVLRVINKIRLKIFNR